MFLKSAELTTLPIHKMLSVMVERRGSAGHPRNCVLAEDVTVLAFCILNKELVPRVLIRNGKRGYAELQAWRNSEKCQSHVRPSKLHSTTTSSNWERAGGT